MNISEIYSKEKIINTHFRKKYDYNSEEIFYKQVLELLCELSEFAYETKCFKYWKEEKQSSPDITISEFADCLMITLCFCDLANINEIELENIEEKDMVKLLSYLIEISKLLNYSDEELDNHCIKKMNKALKMIREK